MGKRKKAWHEDDRFWRSCHPILFSESRLAAASEEVDRIVALLRLPSGTRILDLCCGVGRHSLELARRGFSVVGVDRTREYLERASREARKQGLEVEFVESDMREFVRPNAFDAVLNLFTSFGYFDDSAEDSQVLRNAWRSLRPGGLLLMDLMGKEVLARIFRERDWSEEDGTVLLIESKLDQNWEWIENRWIVLRGDARKEYGITLRLYSAGELRTLLLGCGFTSAFAYGGFGGSPYDHNARRLVMLARKEKEETP